MIFYKLNKRESARFLSLPVIETKYSDIELELAKARTIETLLNSFCREIQDRSGYLDVVSEQRENSSEWILKINFLKQQRILNIEIKPTTALAMFHFISKPYEYSANFRYILDWMDVANLIKTELSLLYNHFDNAVLLEQIRNSHHVLSMIIKERLHEQHSTFFDLNFIESEQSLLLGHSFHPTPKSREGFTTLDIKKYSPEFKAKFKLHYFEIDHEFIKQFSNYEVLPSDVIHTQLGLDVTNKRVLIPVHPWQANYIHSLCIVKKGLSAGWICDRGLMGPDFSPTSSIRTVYHQENPFFYKLSLNVRITNCVRKNAYYELESAVFLDSLIAKKYAKVASQFPNFHVMREPGYLTVDTILVEPEQRRILQESFGLILRDNFKQAKGGGREPILAGMLFSKWLVGAQSYINHYIKQEAVMSNVSYDTFALKWFNSYVNLLLYPILYYHFILGITFEPHLQNVLIDLYHSMPVGIFIRDLEGTKLNLNLWPESDLTVTTSEVLNSVCYNSEKGWRRVAYCLLVNNFGEAIFHIAHADLALESLLWGIVNTHLDIFERQYHVPQIRNLLQGDALPTKANLVTRFLKQADKNAVYINLTDHPFKQK